MKEKMFILLVFLLQLSAKMEAQNLSEKPEKLRTEGIKYRKDIDKKLMTRLKKTYQSNIIVHSGWIEVGSGALKLNGDTIIPPGKYSYIKRMVSDTTLFFVKSKAHFSNNLGICNSKNIEVVPCRYVSIIPNNIYDYYDVAKTDGSTQKQGIFRGGKEIVPCLYSYITYTGMKQTKFFETKYNYIDKLIDLYSVDGNTIVEKSVYPAYMLVSDTLTYYDSNSKKSKITVNPAICTDDSVKVRKSNEYLR